MKNEKGRQTMTELKQVEKNYQVGDIVWCLYSKEDRAKGFIKERLKEETYRVEVFLPRTRDERGLNYVMQDVFESSELFPYEE